MPGFVSRSIEGGQFTVYFSPAGSSRYRDAVHGIVGPPADNKLGVVTASVPPEPGDAGGIVRGIAEGGHQAE
ncbi:MAG: hypothetical protein U9P14_11090 [Gemmatimonadota bacterium]|nr:hypothetical protein [Gemmatimonadota bacterium]